MNIRTPALGDRVVFFYGVMHVEKYGKVIARRESAWGKSWEVQMDEEPSHIEHIERYTGTAEDRGDYAVRRESNGIGVYLIDAKEEKPVEEPKFTKTATVKYLNDAEGHIEVLGRGQVRIDYRYGSHVERCGTLNDIDADLSLQGLQLAYEHRQQLGPNVQTVRLYVETL